MTQISAFWDGLTTGDAIYSTYDQGELAEYIHYAFYSDNGVVLPMQDNMLEVTQSSPAARSVSVGSGFSVVAGAIYRNTAPVTLTVDENNGAGPRIDRVVVRIDFVTRTGVLVLKKGTPSSSPSAPALTQTLGGVWEIPLAQIWCAVGFVTIVNDDINDERDFYVNTVTLNKQYRQLLQNSEWLCHSGGTPTPPDHWWLQGTPSAISRTTKPTSMSRGYALVITSDAATEGLLKRVAAGASKWYTIKVPAKLISGEGAIYVTTDGAVPVTRTLKVRKTDWVEYQFRIQTPADATYIEFRLLANTSGTTVHFGQPILVQGLIPGGYREIHEPIIFNDEQTYSEAGISDKTTTLEVFSTFTAVPVQARALYVRIRTKDTASLAAVATNGAGVASLVGATIPNGCPVFSSCSGITNSREREEHGWVGLDRLTKTTANIYVRVDASGAATLSYTLAVVGVLL